MLSLLTKVFNMKNLLRRLKTFANSTPGLKFLHSTSSTMIQATSGQLASKSGTFTEAEIARETSQFQSSTISTGASHDPSTNKVLFM